MKIVLLVGTRPNYIKAFPVYKQLITNHQVIIIHSGQHFDVEMDKIFFDDLNIKSPDYNLQIRGSMMEQISSIYPVHPRIKDKLFNKYKNIKLIKPLGYINFLRLVSNCHLVITDSGGIQEETSFLGIPCLTFRQNTERPVTIYKGTNKLIDFNEENKTKIKDYILDCSHNANKHNIEGYDGHASKRIAEYINKLN